eukprot:scaffold1279_cov306-Prasinococcus_capsulatus_cf.AAC.1
MDVARVVYLPITCTICYVHTSHVGLRRTLAGGVAMLAPPSDVSSAPVVLLFLIRWAITIRAWHAVSQQSPPNNAAFRRDRERERERGHARAPHTRRPLPLLNNSEPNSWIHSAGDVLGWGLAASPPAAPDGGRGTPSSWGPARSPRCQAAPVAHELAVQRAPARLTALTLALAAARSPLAQAAAAACLVGSALPLLSVPELLLWRVGRRLLLGPDSAELMMLAWVS